MSKWDTLEWYENTEGSDLTNVDRWKDICIYTYPTTIMILFTIRFFFTSLV